MADLLPVDFHGDTLSLVEHNGEPFAAIKPICDAIGLDWTAQHAKLTGWLASISAACLQLESASGILAGLEFARDEQARLDLLTAAHMQCQAAALFICNQYDEVRQHA